MREVHLRSPRVERIDEYKPVAWYDVKGKGWLRDIFVLLHPPYTLWHLSYVPIGASLAPVMNWPLLGWTVLAFFLGMGIGGHCLDELNGRPLKTTLSKEVLGSLAVIGVIGAFAIGWLVGATETPWVWPCIVFGMFIVVAYTLEWGKGFFHRDEWFGIAWGSFPLITAYVAQTHTLSWAAVLLAVFAFLYSMAQRKLSLQSRFWRRRVTHLGGTFLMSKPKGGDTWGHVTKDIIIGPADLALKYLNGAVVAAAIGMLLMHV